MTMRRGLPVGFCVSDHYFLLDLRGGGILAVAEIKLISSCSEPFCCVVGTFETYFSPKNAAFLLGRTNILLSPLCRPYLNFVL